MELQGVSSMGIHLEMVLEYLILSDLIILGECNLVHKILLQVHDAHGDKIESREESIPQEGLSYQQVLESEVPRLQHYQRPH